MNWLKDLEHVSELENADLLAEIWPELKFLDDLLFHEQRESFFIRIKLASHIKLDIFFDPIVLKHHLDLSLPSELIHDIINYFNRELLLTKIIKWEIIQAKLNLIELINFISGFLKLERCIFEFHDFPLVFFKLNGLCAHDLSVVSLSMDQWTSPSIFRNHLPKKQVLNVLLNKILISEWVNEVIWVNRLNLQINILKAKQFHLSNGSIGESRNFSLNDNLLQVGSEVVFPEVVEVHNHAEHKSWDTKHQEH